MREEDTDGKKLVEGRGWGDGVPKTKNVSVKGGCVLGVKQFT